MSVVSAVSVVSVVVVPAVSMDITPASRHVVQLTYSAEFHFVDYIRGRGSALIM